MTVEDLLADCHRYIDTVVLFSVIHQDFTQVGIGCEIELPVQNQEGTKRIPDISHIEDNELISIVEHKASISDVGNGRTEVEDTKEKYSKLVYNGKQFNPNIFFLYPLDSEGITQEIISIHSDSVSFITFDMKSDDTLIKFSPSSDGQDSTLDEFFLDKTIYYNLTYQLGTYYFIRAGPPTIYTAFQLWRALLSLQTIRNSADDTFLVNIDIVKERLIQYYPPWIRDTKQVNSNHLRSGFKFLKEIGFISDADEGNVLVHRSRGTRQSDDLRYFAEKWISKDRKEELPPGRVQSELFDW